MQRQSTLLALLFVSCGSSTMDVSSVPMYTMSGARDVVYGRALRRASWDSTEGTPIDLMLDVYEPSGADGPMRPALVCIPGGGFSGRAEEPGEPVLYSKRILASYARYFCERGWVVFMPGYRLSEDFGTTPASWPPPPADFNETWYRSFYPGVRDCKAALRWIHAHASEYRIDEDRIAVIGGSAGAAIATALGTVDPGDFTGELTLAEDPTLSETNLDARSDVRTVVSFWGNTVAVDALARRDGRSRYDSGDSAFAIVHGHSDVILPFAFAEGLRDACIAASIPHEFHPFEGGHAEWEARLGDETLLDMAFRFIVEQQGLTVR